MFTLRLSTALLLSCGFFASAQTVSRRTVRALGEATVAVTPDQAKVSFAVESRAATAQEAASLNASQTAAVIGALTSAMKTDGSIRTTGYSIHPIYGQQQVLTGFQAINTVELTLQNIKRVGELLDVGTKAGANRVSGLTFGLKDPEPARLQALRQAVVKARAHAEAMVFGLGLRLGPVLNIDEGSYVPRLTADREATAATTPIEVGNVSVTATVVLEIEIV